MAMLTNTVQAVSLFARLDAVIADRRAAYSKWQLYRQTLAELRSLNARELTDLGLAPGSLKAVAREAVYGPFA